MANLQEVLDKLSVLSPEDALLAVLAIEGDRKQKNFARYWSSDTEPQYQFFFDRIEEDFSKFTSDIKIYGLLGGNRSSKTERGAFIAVAWLLGKDYFRDEPSWRYVKDLPIPDHGCHIWAIGLDYNVIKNVIWNEKLRSGHRHPGLLPDSTNPVITKISDSEFQVSVNVNGRKSTLSCKSAESGREKFQSASIDLVWIDEEVEEDIFGELYQRTVDCAGKILITLTPLHDVGSGVRKPWVFDLHKEFKQGRKDVIFVQLSALDNPFIPEDEKVKLRQKWAGHPEERTRLYGDFIKRSGLVYPQWDRTKHILKHETIPASWRRIVSIDPAATGINAAVWAAIQPITNNVYIYRVYYERDKIVSDHARDVLIRNGNDKIDIWLIDPWWAVARSAENHKQGFQLWREAGIPVRPAPKAEDFGRTILSEYLSATLDPTSKDPKLFLMGDLPEIVDEIEGYVWDSFKQGTLKGTSKEKPMKKNDHAMNAIQYLLSMKPKGSARGSVFTHSSTNSYT